MKARHSQGCWVVAGELAWPDVPELPHAGLKLKASARLALNAEARHATASLCILLNFKSTCYWCRCRARTGSVGWSGLCTPKRCGSLEGWRAGGLEGQGWH